MLTIISATLISISIYLSKPLPYLKPTKQIANRKLFKKEEKLNVQEIREVVELLSLALYSGMTVPMAIRNLNQFCESNLAKQLLSAVNSQSLGANLNQELQVISAKNKYWKLITSQLQISWEQGASITDNLIELNEFFIDLERAQILKKVKSAGVRSVIPLGLCFLPAFMLVVVIPLIAGLIQF